MTRITSFRDAIGLLLVASFATVSTARSATLLRIDDYQIDELRRRGFTLPRPASIEIEALGVRSNWGNDDTVYAWILNSTTRKVVWTQERQRTTRVENDRVLRRCKSKLDLDAGKYEVYAWAGNDWGSGIHLGNWDDIRSLSHHQDGDSYGNRELRRAVQDCWVELRSDDAGLKDLETFEPTGEIPGGGLHVTRIGDEAFVQMGLGLDRPMDVRIYALSEFPRDAAAPADGGWIVDATTRNRIWSMQRRASRDAGGAEKNRLFDATIHLDAGHYLVVYGTDDSHSFEQWNSPPPDDPLNWGITVLPTQAADAAAMHADPSWSRSEPLLAMTRIRDQEMIEKAFKLARPVDLQLYALGEWNDRQDEFADRAYITKSNSDEVVWEMTERNTLAAGGAEKNRLFDATVNLPAGEYVAHYETDDSHSYRNWNAAAPYDADAWGLSIYPSGTTTSKDFTVSDVAPASQEVPEGDVLVRLVRVGDDANVENRFTLKTASSVHIFALGEGLDTRMYDYGVEGRMYDYGWIEKEPNGNVVWEMTYRNSRPAGGARKNRKFDGDIHLDAGTYVVHFESDGSHSYGNWNDKRPPDAQRWGITVSKSTKK